MLVYSKAKGLLNSMNLVDQNFSITDISADEETIREQKRQGYETIALVGVDSRETDELMNSDVMILHALITIISRSSWHLSTGTRSSISETERAEISIPRATTHITRAAMSSSSRW